MFETLSDRLGSILNGLTGRGALSEADVSAALREVGYQGWGTAGGSSHSWAGYLAGKVLSKLGRRVTRLPGGEWVHGRLQAALSLASLKDATRRLDRHLQV